MPPSLALLLWFILLVVLLRFDPARVPGTSPALWVPVIWMFIIGSRLPSQWLSGEMGQAAQALEEGNPLDRAVYFALILLAIGILISRSFPWGGFCARNRALVALLSFALISVLWSDFPLVAFKRWFRDLGNYLVILVALSDAHPVEAVCALLRRICYLLIPLSIVFIKYYSYLGIHYSTWTGQAEYIGVATSKNTLGAMCMLSGIFFFWDTVRRWSDRAHRRTQRIILVNVAFLAMTFWLLSLANSATSRVCLILGCLVIAAARARSVKRNPAVLKWLIPASLGLYVVLAFGFGMNSELAGAVGRDPTLTGRTTIWQAVLSTNTNWLLGAGYESFWLGPRLELVWSLAGRVNEAHNGYLQVYLNQGFIGLILLGGLLFSSYRTIFRNFGSSNFSSLSKFSALSVALFTVALFYNITEAAFTASFMCLTFLLGTLRIPRASTVGSIPTREPSLKEVDSKEHQWTVA